MKLVYCIVAAALVIAVAGCSRVQEPWAVGNDHLKAERARTADTQEALLHRLWSVQTDR
jgi:hypothetical protein